MLSKVILAATAIGAVTAQVPGIARREFIENRQDDGLDPACESAIDAAMPIYSELPTLPDDFASVTLPADPCVTPSFTGTLGQEWASYTSGVFAWYGSHSDELNAVITACADAASAAGVVPGVPVCSSDDSGLPSSADATSTAVQTTTTETSEGGSSPTVTPTSGATKPASGLPSSTGASSSGAHSTSSVSTGAAPRETGFLVAAAAAAAGFMGAVAVL
jgi:hypothetical protein